MPPTRSSTRSPTRGRSPTPARRVKAKSGCTSGRPDYHSDADSRPVWRGTFYAIVRRTGVAWAVLFAYTCYAVWDVVSDVSSPGGVRRDLAVCRLLHVLCLAANVILSDDLHNLDEKLGAKAYAAESTPAFERLLHAHDWRGALGVPASYHVLLVCGIIEPSRVSRVDVQLLAANLSLCALMCFRIAPARITPRRELFLSFVATFAAQMVLLLVAFWRERAHHPWWPPLWCVYALGLVAKGLEWPTSDVLGHHELLHGSTILGHALGLLIDATTT